MQLECISFSQLRLAVFFPGFISVFLAIPRELVTLTSGKEAGVSIPFENAKGKGNK
jgi:hypothetical protein